jgi:hypothetical protein
VQRRREEGDGSPNLLCERCQETFARVLIQECSYCSKDFCRNCAVRSGNAAFCCKACAEAWFFTDADEGGEE